MTEYIGISSPLKVVDGVSANLDAKYGPYDSVNHAISEIPISIRRVGLTVGIIFIESSVETIKDYWWKRGIEDADLELKIDSAASTKTSQLENDANFQDGNQVAASLQAQKAILDAVDLNLQNQINTHSGQINTINQKDAAQDTQIQNIITSYIDNKGYFASLASLQTSYPSPQAGDTAYVADALSTTGYYIYNVVGGVWTASIIEAPPISVPINDYALHGYESSPKTLKEVDDSKVEMKIGRNLFNPLAASMGFYLYYENGLYGIGNNASYFHTDYIPIDTDGLYSNKVVGASSIIYHLYYDANKNIIGRTREKIIPYISGAAFVRCCYAVSNIDGLQIEKGSVETTYEAFNPISGYPSKLPDVIPSNSIPGDSIKDGELTILKTDFITQGNNLFNKDTATNGGYISHSNGNIVIDPAWWYSDFIPVLPNTIYSCTRFWQRAFYTANKTFISGGSDLVYQVTSPANAAYMRISDTLAYPPATRMMNEGSSLLPLEPFYLSLKYGQTLDPLISTKVATLEGQMTAANYMIDTLAKKSGYDSLTDVIARTSTSVRSFIDIAGVGANFNKSGQSFNAIKLYGAQRGTIADNRRWAYAQVLIKNAKEDTVIIAKSPLISVDKTAASLNGMVFPLMDSALENFITLTDASFSGATYFVYHLWYNEDMSFAYGGTTQGSMSNYAGTSFYTTNHVGWSPYTANPSIALEHALVVNPQIYTTVPRIETKITEIEAAIELLEPESVEVILPDKIYAIVGDTLQLFYRGIIKAWNPYQYDIAINCAKGAWFPRYFEYTPGAGDVGTTTLQIKVKDNNGKILGSKTCSLITKAIVASPATALKTLFIGDSLTNARIYPAEAFRRLTGSGGTPAGSALTNINFVGRKKFNGVNGVEGNSGWSWGDYLTVGRKAFTFTITPPITMPTVEAVYQDANGKQYTMWWDYSTTSIKMLVNDMVSTPPASGTLTKVSGTGDATIAYSAAVESSGNPFWNDGTSQIDFKAYVDKWLSGTVDVVYTLLTWNSQYGNKTDFSTEVNYAKTLFEHIKANYPLIKIKLMGIQVSDLRGGVRVDGSPAENTYRDTYGLMVTALNMNKAYQDLANDPLFSDYVEFVSVSSQVDSEYNMPYEEKSVNTRFDGITEKIGINDVHPNTNGYYQIADVVFRNFIANFCQ